MTIDEQIEVMQHFRDGGQVQYLHKGHWCVVDDPIWNFADTKYRKKPEPKIIPWTAETIPVTYVRNKDWHRGFYVPVLSIHDDKIIVLDGGEFRHVFYTDLLHDWETRDGKPCGEEVEG